MLNSMPSRVIYIDHSSQIADFIFLLVTIQKQYYLLIIHLYDIEWIGTCMYEML